MKALWRELADPKIKEHHGPVVKTTRLAAIESRKGRLSSSVAPKRSGPSGPGMGSGCQPAYPPALGTAPAYILCCGRPSNNRVVPSIFRPAESPLLLPPPML